jgi:hypothetical protein
MSAEATRIINLGFATDMQFFALGNRVGTYSIIEMMPHSQGSHKNEGVEIVLLAKRQNLSDKSELPWNPCPRIQS